MPAMDCSHIAATNTSHRFVEKARTLSPSLPIGPRPRNHQQRLDFWCSNRGCRSYRFLGSTRETSKWTATTRIRRRGRQEKAFFFLTIAGEGFGLREEKNMAAAGAKCCPRQTRAVEQC
jgi:hypothetical protein